MNDFRSLIFLLNFVEITLIVITLLICCVEQFQLLLFDLFTANS